MASYWIVVPRENVELFELLSAAFRGRTGFNVILDRRSAGAPTAEGDRRTTGLHPGPDEIVIAEQTGQADGSELPIAGARQQARRRIYRRRPGPGIRESHRARNASTPPPDAAPRRPLIHRLFSL
jgi:hypothetical protein